MHSRRNILGYLSALPVMAAFNPAFAASTGKQTPLFLDVDTGRDDAWTILGALDRFEVAGVIASYGNTNIANALRNSLDVVMYGRKNSHHISSAERHMPVFAGAKAPRASAPASALAEIARRDSINGNGMYNVEVPHNRQNAANHNSDWADKMLTRLRKLGRSHYVACGPLTNLAALIDTAAHQNFELRDYIGEVAIMGGSLDPQLAVDFNFRVDPEAARHVLGYFGGQVKLFPYDETKKLAVSQPELGALTSSSPLGVFNKRVMEAYVKGWAPDGQILLHDPSTLLAFEPETSYRPETVSVAADGKLVQDRQGTPIHRFVVPDGQEKAITSHILSRYMDLKPPRL